MKIEIGGHTDSKGTKEYNQRLSENRAKSVVNYLINNGINEKRLKYKGYGESTPIDDNNTESGRINNRRVEFKILSI
jgi:outer membrane protein OmpA-like peptidoglycan-associated protein